MMTARRLTKWLIAGLATAVALFVMARASVLPLPYHSGGTAHLRLSWSARPARIEVCRALSEEELERREEHMRQRVECEGRFATYALRVAVDGRRLDEVVVRGSGLRHDRPIYLLRDFDVAGGAHHVQISFTRRERTDRDSEAVAPHATLGADTGIFAGRAEREAVERTRRARAAVPARLVLDTSMTFVRGRVLIVTFDAARRALVALHDK
jgi:hypothetical protein